MKLSDVINEIQKYIEDKGDKEVNGINITNDKINLEICKINKILICNNGRHVSLNFYEIK